MIQMCLVVCHVLNASECIYGMCVIQILCYFLLIYLFYNVGLTYCHNLVCNNNLLQLFYSPYFSYETTKFHTEVCSF